MEEPSRSCPYFLPQGYARAVHTRPTDPPVSRNAGPMLRRTLPRSSIQGLSHVGLEETGAPRRAGPAKARGTSRRRLDFTRLEPRLLLCGDGGLDDEFAGDPAFGTFPPVEVSTADSTTTSSTSGT